uniref:Uncharacterized protein n=1 Tax=Romanomermis culicivorax TaxID=13658 RepID=A0A915IQE6_ROMCU
MFSMVMGAQAHTKAITIKKRNYNQRNDELNRHDHRAVTAPELIGRPTGFDAKVAAQKNLRRLVRPGSSCELVELSQSTNSVICVFVHSSITQLETKE